MIDAEFLGHVGSKCNIRCNEGFKMDYTDDASAWDKTKPLTTEIECLYDRYGIEFKILNNIYKFQEIL